MQYLRQSTASQSVLIGPFVDSTDGVTAETALTIANTDIRLSANGGNMFAKTSGGGTHDEAGWYTITLDATDTATVGRLQLSVAVAGALPVFTEFQVLEEAVYDALFASGATAPATASALATAQADLDILTGSDGATLSTAAIAAVNATVDTALSDYDAPTNAEMTAAFTEIKGATWATTDTLEAIRDRGDSAWTTATGFSTHSAADVWSVATRVLTANTNLNDPTAAAIADAVWDEVLSGHLTAGTTGASLNAAGSAGDPWTTTLPGAYTGSQAGKILADVLADTGELQTNQSNWITATGFSTHSAADVWAVATRVLTAGTNIGFPTAGDVADAVWDESILDHLTANTTGNFQYVAANNSVTTLSQLGPIGTNVLAILDDTGTTIPGLIADLPTDADVNAQCDTAISEYFGVSGSSLTGIPWNAAWDAEVQSECTDAINALFTFTVSGQVDANIQRINDTAIVGNGVSPKFGV